MRRIISSVKQAYHHKDLRNAAIDETMAMLAETGLASVTLRELARRLGVSHAAPYAHFADKGALLRDVADAGFSRLATALENASSGGETPREAFASMALTYVRFARANPQLYRLMFADLELAQGDACEMSAEGERAFGVLVAAIASLGIAVERDPNDVAITAWALVHGIAMLEIDRRMSGKTIRSGDDVVMLATEVFWKGLHPGS